MSGPLPKPEGVRRRRNKASTARTLTVLDGELGDRPALPELEGGWHPATVEWWADVWASPMAAEYVASDRHGLLVLARLVDSFWRADSVEARRQLAAEVRLQRQCFGLTPIDRRRLQWSIDRADAPPPARPAAPRRRRPSVDPRLALVDTPPPTKEHP